jgi:hypothetical protein
MDSHTDFSAFSRTKSQVWHARLMWLLDACHGIAIVGEYAHEWVAGVHELKGNRHGLNQIPSKTEAAVRTHIAFGPEDHPQLRKAVYYYLCSGRISVGQRSANGCC